MKQLTILFALVFSTVATAQTKNTMHFFIGRSLGQPSIVPIIIAKHKAQNPAGVEYRNVNYGGSFRVANFKDRTFEIVTGLNVAKRVFTCYDLLMALPTSDQYEGYFGDYQYNRPRNVRLDFETFFLPIQFNYNFAGYKKVFHQVGVQVQVGYRDFKYEIERESGNYSGNFSSQYRREDLNLMLLGKTVQRTSIVPPNNGADYGVFYNLQQDQFDQRKPTPTLFDGKNVFSSMSIHYKYTFKVTETFSVFGKFQLQHIIGKNSFFNQSMIYNVQFGISVMDDPLFKFIQRQIQLRKAQKKKKA